MESTSIRKIRLAFGFALIGAVVAGVLFGWSDHADTIRGAGAISAVGLAKAFHFF